jgi:glycosyltransferase involved in cell wall biosynthesis
MIRSITLAIPTHNRAELLGQTFQSLRSVQVPAGIDIDLVTLADACTDNTAEVVEAAKGTLPFPVRLITADYRNLNQGRNACVESSRGEVVLFLDDDVWVNPGLIAGHLQTYHSSPAGIASGTIRLWWRDACRPEWFSELTAALLTQVVHEAPARKLRFAYEAAGANFSVKREIIAAIGGFRPGLDRSGSTLLGGGETELIRRAMAAGYEMWSAPDAAVEHYVSKNRVDGTRYVLDVARGLGMSHVYMRNKLGPAEITRQLLGRSAMYFVNIGRRLAGSVRKNPPAVVDAQCRMQLNIGAVQATIRRATGRSPARAAAPQLNLAGDSGNNGHESPMAR